MLQGSDSKSLHSKLFGSPGLHLSYAVSSTSTKCIIVKQFPSTAVITASPTTSPEFGISDVTPKLDYPRLQKARLSPPYAHSLANYHEMSIPVAHYRAGKSPRCDLLIIHVILQSQIIDKLQNSEPQIRTARVHSPGLHTTVEILPS